MYPFIYPGVEFHVGIRRRMLGRCLGKSSQRDDLFTGGMTNTVKTIKILRIRTLAEKLTPPLKKVN